MKVTDSTSFGSGRNNHHAPESWWDKDKVLFNLCEQLNRALDATDHKRDSGRGFFPKK
jgi:hypothetical protein